MSFDTEFDYSNAQTWITNKIAEYQESADEAAVQISALESSTGYEHLVTAQIASLNVIKNNHDQQVANYTELSDEITNLLAIDASGKTKLYNFWQTTNEIKENYMMRMLFNYTAMVADTDIDLLINDNISSETQKKLICGIVCGSYPINVKAVFLRSRIN